MKSKIVMITSFIVSLCLIGVGLYGMTNNNVITIETTDTSDNGGDNGWLPNWIPRINTQPEEPIDEDFNNMKEFDLTTDVDSVDKKANEPVEIKPDNIVEGIVPVGEVKDDRGKLIKKGEDTKIVCSNLSPNTVYVPNIQLYSTITNKGNLGTFDNEGYFNLPDRFDAATKWVDGAEITDEEGMTLLAAHRTYSGRYGVFNNLVNLKEGSIACVSDNEGNIQKYVVESLKSYDKNELPQEIFEDATIGDKRLTMITCAGELVRKSGGGYSFDSNVIATFKAI